MAVSLQCSSSLGNYNHMHALAKFVSLSLPITDLCQGSDVSVLDDRLPTCYASAAMLEEANQLVSGPERNARGT